MKILRTLFGIPCLAFVLSGVFFASVRLEATETTPQKDGDMPGTFTVGKNPVRILFDGNNLWVANYLSNNVMKMKK